MIICITGDRNTKDKYKVQLRKDISSYAGIENICFIFGDCRGVDTIAKELCIEYKIQYKVFIAKWDKYGKRAGYKRNLKMIKKKPDLVIAYHDDIGNSKGTQMTLNLAKQYKVPNILKPCD